MCGYGRGVVLLGLVVLRLETSVGGAPPGMVWDGQKGWVPEQAMQAPAPPPAHQRDGMMTLGGEEDLLVATARREHASLLEASELSVELAKESMLEVNSGGLSDQEALEAAVVAEAIAAPLIGPNGEDRSVPAPREDSGAGRRDDVRAPPVLAAEEFIPAAGEFIPGVDMMPQDEDPQATAVREETEAAMVAQQLALDAAKAKIDRLHASLAEGKAPVDMTAPPQGATTKMKRVAGGRTPVGDMDANRDALLGGSADRGAEGGGDAMDPDDARLIHEKVQAKREEAMLMREMARSRMRRGRNTGEDISPMERDLMRQQARAEERRQPGWEPSHGYGNSAEDRLAQARAKRDHVAPPPLSGPPPPPPSTATSTAGAATAGIWYQVDGGGAVAFRSKPEKNARTKVVAEAHTLVYAVSDPAAPDGWIKTNAGLWLPLTYLIGPLSDRDGPSVAEAAEAHAAHAALAAAEGYFREPVAPPPVSPPAPAPEPSWATGCMDSDWKCNLWAASGECEADAAFMGTKCRLACGLCTPTESESASVAGSSPGAAMLEDLYAKAKAELPPPSPRTAMASATAVGGTAAASVDDARASLPPLEEAPPVDCAAADDAPVTDAQDAAAVPTPQLRTIRRSSSGGGGGGGTQRRTLSSRPTKLVTKSPSLKQELERTRQAVPKLETKARPELKTNGRATAATNVDTSDGMNPSDLPSTLEDERAWLQAQKQRLQKEQDEVQRALAEASQPATMGMGSV